MTFSMDMIHASCQTRNDAMRVGRGTYKFPHKCFSKCVFPHEIKIVPVSIMKIAIAVDCSFNSFHVITFLLRQSNTEFFSFINRNLFFLVRHKKLL